LIDRALRRLRQLPSLGRPRDDLFAGCGGLQVEHHVIFYRVDDTVIRIIRILHERMDPTRRVKD
jgi:plasmid stabilization system protein ParE